jgi:hypothetical protein
MDDTMEEVVPGLTVADVRKMADQVFKQKDGNHPQSGESESGFMDILQNGKAEMSASPIFISKIQD